MPQNQIPEFLFPRRLVREAGATGRVGELLRSAAIATGSVLVAVDRVVHEQGLAASLVSGLEAAGYSVRIFDEIAGEPEIPMVARGIEAGRSSDAVAVVGLGGGSALDTAKLIAYSTVSDASLASLKGPLPELGGFPPLVLIPTTVGTGAEATRVAMYAVNGTKRIVTCPQFVPDLAVLDADLLAGLPGPVMAATALDALSHAIESMMSTTANELTRQFSSAAARIIFERLRPAIDGTDDSARADLLYASFLAGVALNAGVVLGHSMSYILSGRHHLAHGVGCALALPYCLAYNQGMDPGDASMVAAGALVGGGDLHDVATAVADLSAAVGLPADLASLGTGLEELPGLATRLIAEYPRPTNPVVLDPDRLARLLTFMHTGDLEGAWKAMGQLQ